MTLFEAIRENDIEALGQALRDDPDLEQEEAESTETPLTLAVGLQRVDALRLLLKAGANPNYVMPDLNLGLTTLQAAARQPVPELTRLLIDAGADLNAVNRLNATALNVALDQGNLETAEVLLNAGADVNAGTNGFDRNSALKQAVSHGYFDLIPRLLELGADPNRANTGGGSALVSALVKWWDWQRMSTPEEAAARRYEVADQLLSAGADPNVSLTESLYLTDEGVSLPEGTTPLMMAARLRDRSLMQRLLEAGADPTAADAKRQTALDWAVKAGHPDIVQFLQRRGDATDIDHEALKVTSLMTAAREGNIEQVRTLLKEGVDPNVLDPSPSERERSALLHAVAERHFPVVELLLEAGANPNQQEKLGGRDDESALHHAAIWRDARFAKALLQAGANPDVFNTEHATPLVEAATQDNLETVELLLRAGASIVLPERENGIQPLRAALKSGATDIAHRLLDAGHPLNGSVLVDAAHHGQASVVQRILEAGISPDGRFALGYQDDDDCVPGTEWSHADYEPDLDLDNEENRKTALIAAAEMHIQIQGAYDESSDHDEDIYDIWRRDSESIQQRIIQSLIDAGADFNLEDDCGRTPLIALAAMNNQVVVTIDSGSPDPEDDDHEHLMGKLDPIPVMKLLLAAGADINASDHEGRTALHRLISKTRGWSADPLPVIRFLIDSGAQVDARTNEGQTPLMFAIDADELNLVRLLIETGADVNAVDDRGRSPLIHAAENAWDAEIVQEIIDAGADVHQRNSRGETALSIAHRHKHDSDLFERLIQANAEDPREREIALSRAVKEGDRPQVRRLLESGADANYLHPGGTVLQTALHEFVISGGNADEKIIQDLLDAGASVTLYSESSSYFPPLVQAIGLGRLDLVRSFLERGADPHANFSRERNPIIHAAQCGNREILDLLLKSGTPEDDLTRIFLAAYRWEDVARSEHFAQCVADLEEFTGEQTRPFKKDRGRGAVWVVIDAEQETQALRESDPDRYEYSAETIAYRRKMTGIFEALHERFLQRGCSLCRIGPHAVVERGRILGLFPTASPFEIIASTNVSGNEVGLSTAQVVSWFRKFFVDHPFRLTACLGDVVEVTLLKAVSDPKKLARTLYRFCPDMVDQGTDTVEALAEQLRHSPHLHFWWD